MDPLNYLSRARNRDGVVKKRSVEKAFLMMMYAKDQEVFENVLSPETLSVSQFVKKQREEIKALNF